MPDGKTAKAHARFNNLPRTSSVDVEYLGAEHLDKLIIVEGVVSWITDIKPLMKVALWECIHCEATFKTINEKGKVKKPGMCKCGRRDFRLVEQSSEFINIQRAQMQESIEKLRGNKPSSQIELWMEDDLTNKIFPGQKIIITGMLRLRPSTDKRKDTGIYQKFLDVRHLQKVELEFEELKITKEEEEEILRMSKDPKLFEKITQSIAPSIYGYKEMKQAIALQLFGGTPGKVLPDGEKIRAESHTLLIGDPGTAKSSLLEYVSHLAPKSVFVSGGAASGVGLTASAEKDKDGEGWILKAGAMVLANGGIAIIDEFDKMRDEDRGSIHEAMEQQTISVAKAGIVTQFSARTSVLAAANPKMGRFDPNIPPSQQFNITPALLSRFDLIFTIRDVLDEGRDRKMASHILAGHKFASQKEKPPEDHPILPEYDADLLRKYIAYTRRTCRPVLTDEAMEKIKDYYVDLRKIGAKQNTYPITARQIEGIIRLAEASAKMRLSDRVEILDAERAINLEQFVLELVYVDKTTGKLDSDVINIGKPKSRLDRLQSLVRILNELEDKTDLVSIEDAITAATDYGIDQMEARRLIAELERQGDIYKPKPGFIKSAHKH